MKDLNKAKYKSREMVVNWFWIGQKLHMLMQFFLEVPHYVFFLFSVMYLYSYSGGCSC